MTRVILKIYLNHQLLLLNRLSVGSPGFLMLYKMLTMVVRLCMIWWEPISNFPSGNPSCSLCSSHKIFNFPEYTSSLMLQGHYACCLICLECCFYHSSLVSLLLILQIACHFFHEVFLETFPFHCLNYLFPIILSHSTLSQYYFNHSYYLFENLFLSAFSSGL